MNRFVRCSVCGKEQEYGDMYEYRGAISCENCFDELQRIRDRDRAALIEEERHKTERFRGLDMSDGVIGRANREILKQDIDIAKRESARLHHYESPTESTPQPEKEG